MVDAMEEENKIGSPWSVLPIKNNKYAKDLLDVHLSDRGLTSLEKFEQFPNLEVIWLNNNQVSKPLECVVWSCLTSLLE
jgi:Leucine-rich repeat (LRR) protein